MSKAINLYLAQALAEFAVFIEFSGEDIIDPDAAAQAMEQLSASLQLADADTKKSLCSQFKNVALNYSDDKKTFLNELGESLGLTEG